LSIPVSLEEN